MVWNGITPTLNIRFNKRSNWILNHIFYGVFVLFWPAFVGKPADQPKYPKTNIYSAQSVGFHDLQKIGRSQPACLAGIAYTTKDQPVGLASIWMADISSYGHSVPGQFVLGPSSPIILSVFQKLYYGHFVPKIICIWITCLSNENPTQARLARARFTRLIIIGR